MFPADVTASVDTGVLSTFACWLKDPNLDAACGQAREPPATHTVLELLLSYSEFQRLDTSVTGEFRLCNVISDSSCGCNVVASFARYRSCAVLPTVHCDIDSEINRNAGGER